MPFLPFSEDLETIASYEHQIKDLATQQETAVIRARSHGAKWREIAFACGLTTAACFNRYKKLFPREVESDDVISSD